MINWEIDLLRKTPALTGVFLLSVMTKKFPSVSTCHFLGDDFVSKKSETKIPEEVPHMINWLKNKNLLPVTSGQGRENYRETTKNMKSK